MRNQFIIILTFIFIISGCKKEQELGVFLLDEMKNENPYTGYETLKYLDNNGDTIVFQGNGRYTEEFHSEYNFDDPNKYYVNEMDKCSFTSEENNYEIYIQLTSRTIGFYQGGSPETITGYPMDIQFEDQSGENTKGCKSYTTNVSLPIIDYQNSDIFYDSLSVDGIYYHNVVSFSSGGYLLFSGDCNERMKVDTIFYCTSDGIIKLTFINNITWNLLNNK